MRVLILFASREGQTGKIANRLCEHLQQSGLTVDVVDAADDPAIARLDLAAYQLLVFGASLHAGGLERELKRFIDSNADRIGASARSFFLVSLSAATSDPELRAESLADAREKMNRQLPVPFDDVEMVAGALRYSMYSRPVKWLMQRIASQAGEETDPSRDYEYTDWQQVEGYAARLQGLLAGQA